MTDRPEYAPLTLEQLDAIESGARYELDSNTAGCNTGYPVDWRELLAMTVELRRHRAILADLKAEGCPTSDDGAGGAVCAYCEGPMIDTAGEPEYDHRPMDGEPCLWPRIESA